ncbi:MAG: serine/threonine-protein phosphatase [candidate division KSB1 bacterium]|nr:serine/threonine-protein phosphatase [candidate division KSB1 bacterium]MDZ7368883.1 serine/threonine-protein phosphatase [candidate division KSB1 bacterium]MDZ7406871.1 serine/threonine-protein phosphatase [candidate division KSB1 bacterium]
MRLDPRLKSIFLALAGVASLAVYLWLFAESKPIQLLRSAHTREEILAKAEQAYRASPLGGYDWPHALRVNVDDDLFRYIQSSPNGDSLKSKLPVGWLEVSWKGKIEPPKQGLVVVDLDDEKKSESGRFIMAMEVGGDYYDFIEHDDSRLGVVIGDVSGKGVSAAFFMTMAKGIIQALSRINPSPKSLLSDMNSVFYENTPREVFISLIYGFFDVDNNTLIFARAGHNPLIVRKSVGGAPELLNPRGLAIGLEKGNIFAATIEEKTVPIQKGDVFVFYTDGISEMMNKNGEEFGEERLSQLVNRHAQESAATILEKVTQEVNHFAGGANQHDDFTMVVVKVVG